MGTNTLNNRSAGQTIQDTFFNDIHQAMNGDFVGRGGTGVPAAGQNLGTVAIPWGSVRADTLILSGSAIDTSSIVAPANRVISGKMRGSSNQPAYITPNGGALSFVVDGTPVNLVVSINGASVSVISDITKSSLTAAPSSNNTCLVDNANAGDQFDTKLWGGDKCITTIGVDNMGSEISSLIGQYAAFQIAGVSNEYFIAFVKSATELSKCYRGFFYDSSLNPVKATAFSNNDVITLLKLGYIFIENDGVVIDVTYNPPVYSFQSPSSPVTGDYWFDLANQVWKRYDGASFQIINRIFIGWFANNTTSCVAARSVDFYSRFNEANTIVLEQETSEIIRMKRPFQAIQVMGNLLYFGETLAEWNITTDLAASTDNFDASEQNDRMYYLYLKDTGETIISDIPPYRRSDLLGEYHPYNPWRAIGVTYNNASGDLQGVESYSSSEQLLCMLSRNGTQSIPSGASTTVQFNVVDTDDTGLFNTSNYTFTFKRTGKYHIQCAIEFGGNPTGNRRLWLHLNGGAYRQLAFNWGVSAGNSTMIQGSTTILVSTGDSIFMNVEQNSGGALNIADSNALLNYLTITRVGD